MENFNKCNEILNELYPNARYWGRYIDTFLPAYKLLSAEEKKLLNEQTPSSVRYGLMHQYLASVSRSIDQYNSSDVPEVLQNVFILLVLDNCDYEYRETILSLRTTLEMLRDKFGPSFLHDSWMKYKSMLPEKAFLKTKNTFMQILEC